MMRTRVFSLVMILMLIGCAPQAAPEEEPIKIGAVLSMTGFASIYGQNSQDGLELALKEINDAGGVLGRPIKIVYEDDTTNGRTAVTAAQKLISVDKVVALIGGTWDLSLEPIVPVADSAKLIIINPSTGNTKEDSRLSPYLFRTFPSVPYQVNKYEPVLLKENINTIVIFRNDGPWAFAQKNTLQKLMEKNGGKLIADFAGPNIDNNDFRTEVTKLKELRPDAIYLALGFNDAANVVKRMNEQGVYAKILSSEGSLKDALNKNLLQPSDAEGAYFTDSSPIDPEFISKYKAMFGKNPDITTDLAYAALKLLAQAYQATGTTDTETVREYLQNLPLFDANGDATPIVNIYKIEKGATILQTSR